MMEQIQEHVYVITATKLFNAGLEIQYVVIFEIIILRTQPNGNQQISASSQITRTLKKQ